MDQYDGYPDDGPDPAMAWMKVVCWVLVPLSVLIVAAVGFFAWAASVLDRID